MTKQRFERMRVSLLLSVVTGRFETFDAVLLISMLFHGVWFVLPFVAGTDAGIIWDSVGYETTATVLGVSMIVVGVGGLLSLHLRKVKLRSHFDMAQFLLWLFLSIMMPTVGSVGLPIWAGYLTIAMMAGVVRMNSSHGL